MNIGSKLQRLRKEKGLSQEQLAEIMGVSRQSISKWELDMAYPETEKLIKLAHFYQVTIDSLLNIESNEVEKQNEYFIIKRFHYEYKSKRTLFGLPLVHINIGHGFYVSKGIISIGMIARGFLSLGLVSMGLLSLGVFSLGFISLGAFAFALILALGSIAVGTIAIGAIAIGVFSIGAISIGLFSYGSLSIAKYVAVGDHASGMIAIGKTKATGTYTFLPPYQKQKIYQLISSKVPSIWKPFIDWIKQLINSF